MKIEDLNNKVVKIENFKTTFITLNFENEIYRFNYVDKKEAFLKQNKEGILKSYSEHPLLINYNENFLEIFINSSPLNSEAFIEEIKYSINKRIENYRDWKNYINLNTGINFKIFEENIKNGNGKILYAPISIVENIEKICDKYNVKIKVFGEKVYSTNKLIVIGDQYIICKDFQLFIQ